MRAKVDELLSRVVDWATKFDSVLGISLVGSYARNTARPDSDIDLVILSSEATNLLADTGWVTKFGKLINLRHGDYGLVQSVHVLYENNLEVEYGITTLEWMSIQPVDAETREVVADGMQILYDPQNAFRDLQAAVNRSH